MTDEGAPRLVILGHILEERIRFPDREIGPVVGSPAAYASVAAARVGVSTGVVSVIAPDAGAFLLAPLAAAGVDVAGVARRGVTRTSILAYDERGNKSIDYVRVAEAIGLADVPTRYLGAEGFLACPLDFEVAPDVVEALARSSRPAMIDLGGYGGVVSTRHPMTDPATAEEVARLVAGVDVVKASLEDCRSIVGLEDPWDCAKALVELGAPTVLVTCGGDGSVLREGGRERWVSAFDVAALDATGAGDVFCGAFLAELIRSGRAGDAAEYGSAAAALFVQGTGGVSAERSPDDERVRDLVRVGRRRNGPPRRKTRPGPRAATRD